MYYFVIVILSIFLSGCHPVHKDWQIASGSKADALVTLSYITNDFELVTTNMEQEINLARNTCKKWGYRNASPYAFTKSECINSNSYSPDGSLSCGEKMISKNYQCHN